MTPTLVRNHSHWGAFLAEVENGRVVGVRPFEHDPAPSRLIEAIPAAVHSPTRIARPMVREGWLAQGADRGPGRGAGRGREPFVPVAWEHALDLVAGELARVRREHGHDAIMGGSQGWGSAGIFHDARAQVRRFLSASGGFIDQASNYSFGAALVFLPHVLGSAQAVTGPLTSWSSIARHGRLMVLFGGANPKNLQVVKGGCGAHANRDSLASLARAGVAVVNVSPIREDGPDAVAPEWIAIRPNTDAAMLLALAHTLIAEGRHDQAFLARCCVGFERVQLYLMGASDGQSKDADWAAAITGVPAETIRALARRMAATRTLVTASWSLQRADHGEQAYWALILLAACLGQIGLPGGGFGFGYGSTGGIADPPLAFKPPTMDALANPLAKAIPAARIADCLGGPGERYDFNGRSSTFPDIRLVYWAGGNPFHHHQDINRLRAAWRRPETIIVHEPWWTATARHADIVLPATTTLERNDIGCAPRDRFVIAMQKAIDPVGEARSDFAIFADLARRLGCADAYAEGRDEAGWLRHLYAHWRASVRTNAAAIPDFDRFWREGFLEIPQGADDYVLFADFRADPQAHPLATPSGRIELYSERIAGFGYDDCPPHPTWLAPAEWLGGAAATAFPLHLVSSQPRHRLHSQMDPGPVSAAGKVAGREAVAIHPHDAAARGIADGDLVRVYNARGACLAGAQVTDAVRPGVLRLSCGAWYDPSESDDGAMCVHGNANMLTRDRGTSRLAQGPTSATTLVEVERWTAPAPPLRAFVPPESVASDTA
ncbi:MAG TPA: molybdopterin-dependent oxidoreductase [Xanthobacteraceae bacterium]|nr:molybdopterin-dependent oxidoreductase [Xanthobacteraceae bacterium]